MRLRRLVENWRAAGDFQKRATLLGGTTILSQGLQALALPFLARLYPPNVFGEWALLQSIAFFVAIPAGLRYEMAIVVAENDREAINVAIVQFAANLAICCGALILVTQLATVVAAQLGAPSLSSWLYAVPFMALLTAAGLLATNWLVRAQRFKAVAACMLAQTMLATLLPIVLVPVFQGSVGGIVAAAMAGQLAFLPILLRHGRSTLGINMSGWSFAEVRSAARKHASFPKFMVPYNLVGALRERGLIVVLGVLGSPQTVGWYALAARVTLTPMSLASNSMNSVLFEHAARQADVSSVAPLVNQVLTRLTRIAVPAFVCLAFWAPDLFEIVLGDAWRNAGVYVTLLALPGLFYMLQGWLDRLLTVVKAQGALFAIEVTYTGAALTSFAVAFFLFRSVLVALSAFAALSVVYHAIIVLTCYRRCRFPVSDLTRVAVTALLLGASTALVLLICRALAPEPYGLVLSLLSLLAYYGALMARETSEDSTNLASPILERPPRPAA